MMKSVLILDEFFAMTAKIRTLFLSHINIVKYLTHRNTEVLNCPNIVFSIRPISWRALANEFCLEYDPNFDRINELDTNPSLIE